MKFTLAILLFSLTTCEFSRAATPAKTWDQRFGCDPKICSDICGTTGLDDFTSYTCNPFTCKCYCNNPPPPNCFPDQNGRCDLYCKETYCGAYFGVLCGSYNNPICTCACNPYGPYLRNGTHEPKTATSSPLRV